MGNPIKQIEKQRLMLQADLDSLKSKTERNYLGQFATPTALAFDMLKYASTLLSSNESIQFLDPAIGTGAFYSALKNVFPERLITKALGFEIDPFYAEPTRSLWEKTGLILKSDDFTKVESVSDFNLIICNPPYVRHHHLSEDDKARLQFRTMQVTGIKFSKLAGLYCYFLGLSHEWMAEGGIAGWLIPSEFMDVNYGQDLKRYLLDKVTLLHIHRFDPNNNQFADALVTSSIVWFRKKKPPKNNKVRFTFGGTLINPRMSGFISSNTLASERKWSRFPFSEIRTHKGIKTISDFFQIKRGIATGSNDYFILNMQEIADRDLPIEVFRPILPSPRYINNDEVLTDENGFPKTSPRLFLLDTQLSEAEIKVIYPRLYAYLEEGKKRGINERYLCKQRKLWYAQEYRQPAPIVCTYLGRGDTKRGRPFRFILNNSNATVANVYLAMYPKRRLATALKVDPGLLREVWKALNKITPDQLLREGRVYGGGLYKLEPKELANVDAGEIDRLIPISIKSTEYEQLNMFD